MSLVELIAQADERGLAVTGLACLDRCVPLLGAEDDDILRPLWGSLSEGGPEWGECLDRARAALPAGPGDGAGPGDDADGPAGLAHRMLAAAPGTPSAPALREWADACSVGALRIHRMLDPLADGAGSVTSRREGRTEGMSPLVAAELRRQVQILELLATHGANGLRPALDMTTEGRRVLRAVVSRRARSRV
ncbi:hypothetical protein [Streptomyces sp. NPDC046821]|uniref:hypothetical protein n=1 Tax=Streptomyces sp. NPDC046821 TaxID=3154702 RepID=UPI0033FD44D7